MEDENEEYSILFLLVNSMALAMDKAITDAMNAEENKKYESDYIERKKKDPKFIKWVLIAPDYQLSDRDKAVREWARGEGKK